MEKGQWRWRAAVMTMALSVYLRCAFPSWGSECSRFYLFLRGTSVVQLGRQRGRVLDELFLAFLRMESRIKGLHNLVYCLWQ